MQIIYTLALSGGFLFVVGCFWELFNDGSFTPIPGILGIIGAAIALLSLYLAFIIKIWS